MSTAHWNRMMPEMDRDTGLSLRSIYQMGEAKAHDFLCSIRWFENEGRPTCPRCDCDAAIRIKTRKVFRCKRCDKQFSLTSGTRAASRKMPYTDMIAMTYVFGAGAKGISSIQLARMVGVNQRTAFRFAHLLRDAIENEISAITLDGIVEIDGATFGGHRRHANIVLDGKTKRWTNKITTNKRVIVVAKRRGGRTIPFVGRKESDAVSEICRVIEQGSIIQADGARAWDGLAKLFDMMRIEHSYAFSANQACTNNAESYFSQMRRLHSGVHHQMTPKYLRKYACEQAWRLDFKELTPDERTVALLRLLLTKVIKRDVEVITHEEVEAAA